MQSAKQDTSCKSNLRLSTSLCVVAVCCGMDEPSIGDRLRLDGDR